MAAPQQRAGEAGSELSAHAAFASAWLHSYSKLHRHKRRRALGELEGLLSFDGSQFREAARLRRQTALRVPPPPTAGVGAGAPAPQPQRSAKPAKRAADGDEIITVTLVKRPGVPLGIQVGTATSPPTLLDVVAASPAAVAGARKGYTIWKVNGTAVADHKQFDVALAAATDAVVLHLAPPSVMPVSSCHVVINEVPSDVADGRIAAFFRRAAGLPEGSRQIGLVQRQGATAVIPVHDAANWTTICGAVGGATTTFASIRELSHAKETPLLIYDDIQGDPAPAESAARGGGGGTIASMCDGADEKLQEARKVALALLRRKQAQDGVQVAAPQRARKAAGAASPAAPPSRGGSPPPPAAKPVPRRKRPQKRLSESPRQPRSPTGAPPPKRRRDAGPAAAAEGRAEGAHPAAAAQPEAAAAEGSPRPPSAAPFEVRVPEGFKMCFGDSGPPPTFQGFKVPMAAAKPFDLQKQFGSLGNKSGA
eukprot:TRINITY_DN35550_c0_g1_i1.p1 TRINITY_DN35550_c0_g1~~TRINITY_DN35550_c0_g1_i1.p1  ORF type:complete len:507 (+),score=129.49 TRINITY_DN35550_c0_g1_i1:84-1523(+)